MVPPLPDSQCSAELAESTSAPLSEPPVLDTSVFQELLQTLAGDLDVVVSIYRTFLGTAAMLIDRLSDQDCAAQAATLHTLKGSAAMVGAMRLGQLAARLHQVASTFLHPVVETRIEELTGELDIFRRAINAQARSFQYRSEI